MKPATPRTEAHDSACPHCGEPFKAHKIAGIRMGTYACNRCKDQFSLFGSQHYNGKGTPMPPWDGEPL